jgi:predicted alpha/beta hydrolase family esterase
MSSRRVLILPGLGNSGPEHWQTLWEQQHGYARVDLNDWDAPSRNGWMKRLEAAIEAEGRPVVLVAHSLACALIAYAAKKLRHGEIAAALLVAPPDVDDAGRTPEATRSFAPLPLKPLGFPATVVASRDDPFCPFERAAMFADRWDARFEDAGAIGHINQESGIGAWPTGHRWLLELAR